MLYDDPEDDTGYEPSPEERAVNERELYPEGDYYDEDKLEYEWLDEIREFEEELKDEKEEKRQRRSQAAKKGWERRRQKSRYKKRPRKELRSIDAPWEV